MSETCATCRWWAGGPKHGNAECRRWAPVLVKRGEFHASTEWPVTVPGDWCGEHEPQPAADGGGA